MAKTLTVSLVTPEKTAFESQAEFVVLPAVGGEMGILPNHAPFLVGLAPGEARITAGGETRRFAVSGGFAEVKDNKISLFAETAEMADAIDEERAKQALEKAKAEARGKEIDPFTLAAAEASIRRAQVRLSVAGRKRREPSRSRGD